MTTATVENFNAMVVDDEVSVRKVVKKVFTSLGLDVDEAEDGLGALGKLEGKTYDLVITDIKMPKMDGMKLLEKIIFDYPYTDVMIMTAYSTDYTYVDVVSGGAMDFIVKPFSTDELKAKIYRIARERRLINELKESNRKLEATYKEILALKDDEELRCREINYEKELLLEELEKLRSSKK
ncbi:Chemotaxis regulator - transmits chemoreceptor signals to flagelllar motor components CheY [hydrothermal vent metagenome]|uniref:Chemotaxis regulator - transmits chemoreceptor signals to flagelllar motor components CheY n=1 Tax=hydrothermal vent metagenome TaxID=652676 RepID=A0A3B1BFL3_9ZZZZ